MSDHTNTPPTGLPIMGCTEPCKPVRELGIDRLKWEQAEANKKIEHLLDLEKKLNGLAWKVALAAIGGGGGIPVVLSQLGVI